MEHHSSGRLGTSAGASRIDIMLRLERLVDELERAVSSGSFLPGHSCSIAELGEREGVQSPLLTRRLHAKDRGGLLAVRGDAVFARELDPVEFRQMHLTHALLRDHLTEHALGVLGPTQLAELRARFDGQAGAVDPHGWARVGAELVSFGDVLVDVQRALCRAGANATTELSLFEDVQTVSRRYYALGWAAMCGPDSRTTDEVDAERCQMVDRWRELLTLAEAGRSSLAMNLLREDAKQCVRIAFRGIETDWSRVPAFDTPALPELADSTDDAVVIDARSRFGPGER